MDRRRALITIGLSSLAVPFLSGCKGKDEQQQASGPESTQPEDDDLVDLLFVQEAQGVRFEGHQMTLVNVDPRTMYFADRPGESAGYLSFTEFVDLVSEGPDSFSDDPPNATLVVMDGDNLNNVVVRLSEKPVLDGQDLVFAATEIIMGDPPNASGPVALFIDTIGRPLTPVSGAGVHRRHRRRHRRAVRRHT